MQTSTIAENLIQLMLKDFILKYYENFDDKLIVFKCF